MKKLALAALLVLLCLGTSQAVIIDDFTEDTGNPDGWICLHSEAPPEVLTAVRLGTTHIIGGRCDITVDVKAGNPGLDNPMVCYDKGGCDPDYGCWPASASYSSFFRDRAFWVMEYGKQADLNADLTCENATSINIDFEGDLDDSNPVRPVPTTISLTSGKGTPQQANASKTLNLIYDGSVQFPFADFPGINFSDIDYIKVKLDLSTVATDAVDFAIYKIYTIGECPPTAITLSSFEAVPGNGQVVITWKTETEKDNVGFNLYRSEQKNTGFVKINAGLLPAQGSEIQGASYQFIDTPLKNRKVYYYKLEDVDAGGATTEHGPIKSIPRFIHAFGKK